MGVRGSECSRQILGVRRDRGTGETGRSYNAVAQSMMRRHVMPKLKKPVKKAAVQLVQRVKVSAAESLVRVQAFGKRKEQFVAAIRKGKN